MAPATPGSARDRVHDAAAPALSGVFGPLFDSTTRLYRLEAEGPIAGLQVEAFVLEEALSQPWRLELSALHERADLDIDALLGQQVILVTVLADGSDHRRTGTIAQVAAEDSDGGFARYRLVVQPWLGFLSQSIRSFAWTEKDVVAIVDSILQRHAGRGNWRWSPCALQLLAEASQAGVRSSFTQYRESDLHCIDRLLAEEGIAYRFEEAEGDSPACTVVFFADSTAAASIPEDASSASAAGGLGLRLAVDATQQEQDTVQAFGGVRGQPVAVVSAVSYDYKTGRVIGAEVPTIGSVGGQQALRLEAYDATQGYAYADSAQAERALRLKQQALEARHKVWIGRGGVRSFGAGSRFTLTESIIDSLSALRGAADDKDNNDNRRFLLTRVTAVGINNLPKETNDRLAARGMDRGVELLPGWIDAELLHRAAERGYANTFEAIRATVPWRPLQTDETGTRLNPKPCVAGPLLATVVGPDGSKTPRGHQEVWTDRLGRVFIRYEFQDAEPESAQASTWVRVLQPLAGDGTGMSFIPRIGHEVLVGFFDDDVDRPYVICSLYNGRGEGGEAPTPGGGLTSKTDTSAFAQSSDARPGGQGNLTGGNSPAWHGAGTAEIDQGGQRNAAALSGYRTKEFGGSGYNQLVFDDSTAQLRLQLATSQHASQLSLGHLIHQADNHRGSFRGLGFELRTDAYGAVRGGQGVLLSTYAVSAAEPAGDNAAGIALARQWKLLAEAFDQAAQTHQTVRLSGVIGTTGASRSSLDEKAAPHAAWLAQTSGMVSAQGFDAAQTDAGNKSTSTAQDKVPHGTDAVVNVSARGGLAMVAGQDAVFASEENVQLGSGQDVDVAAGGAWRLHTGQAIGVLGGAIGAGEGKGEGAAGTGLTMVAGSGDTDIQAQAGTLQVAALTDVVLQSENAGIDLAAAKKITLSTAGGASITIEGGNITFECPGTLTVRAGKKSFVGPVSTSYALPVLPTSEMRPIKFALSMKDIPGAAGAAPVGQPWHIVVANVQAKDGSVPAQVFSSDHWTEKLFTGVVGGDGEIHLTNQEQRELNQRVSTQPGKVWLVSGLSAMPLHPARWIGKSENLIPEKVLDALNFAPDGRGLDSAARDWLAEHAKADGDANGLNSLKPKTQA